MKFKNARNWVESRRPFFRDKEHLELLEGPISENLFYLSLPIIVINLLRTAYNIADAFWLGQYSKEALAAVTFGFPLVFFLISLGLGLSVAGSVLVAQFEGRGKSEKVEKAASQTIFYGLAVAATIGTVAYFHVGKLLPLLGAEGVALTQATTYMQIVSMGLFTLFGFSMFIALMRGYGDTFTPMLVMLATVIVNVVLDPFLIFGWSVFPKMGVAGAAVATVFSRFLALMAGIGILYSGKKGISIDPRKMKPDLDFLKKMGVIGLPASLEATGRSLSVNMVVAIVGTFSTTIVSGYGIGIRIFSLVFLPAMAVGRGVETMTGQNLGGRKGERAMVIPKVAARTTMVILSVLGLLVFMFPDAIASVFTKNREVAKVGGNFLRWTALSFGFVGVLRSFTGAFRGAGRTMLAAFISISTLGLIRLPMAWQLSTLFDQTGIWVAFPVSNVIGGLMAFAVYKFIPWRRTVD